ncbi:tyrosine-type recombinase/integrase [Ruminococcus sp.]|nr:MAG TPA: Integrase [Caudoviricetes sp.]
MAKLKKRQDGRYQKSVYLGKDENGNRRYKTVNGYSIKEVEEKAQLIKLQIGKGIDVLNAEMKWGKLVDLWLAHKKPFLKERQYKNYVNYLSHFSSLNERSINKLVKTDFQQIILDEFECNSHTRKPTAKKTLREWRGAARQVFNYAIENRILDYSPAQYIEIPRNAKTTTRRALTAQEQLWVISTEHRAQLPAMIMLLAGLRLGECLALQWQDINFNQRTISVHQKLITKGKVHIEQGAKTVSGVRTVTDVPKLLIDFLKKQPEHKPDDFVVTSAKGALMSDTAWRRLWNSYMTELNIKYGDFSDYKNRPHSKFDPAGVPFVIDRFTAHSLRHTCATNLLYTGHELHYVQKQMGHAKPSTTLDIYTHYVESLPKRKTSKIISIDSLVKEFKPLSKQA